MKPSIKKTVNVLGIAAVMLLTASYSTQAQITVTCRPDSCEGNDAYVFRNASDTSTQSSNNGRSTELQAYAWTAGGNQVFTRFFIDFNALEYIPLGATIISATLYLHTPASSIDVPQGNSGTNACWIQRVTSSWNQATVNWDNQPSVVTTDEISMPASTSQWSYNAVQDVKVLVQDIVNQTVANRHGFGIRLQTESTFRSMLFNASEIPDTNMRPKLVVVYDLCTNGTPEARMSNTPTLDLINANTLDQLSDAFPVAVGPNPTKDNIHVSYELPTSSPATINLLSVSTGGILKTINIDGSAGKHSQEVFLDNSVTKESTIIVQVVQGNAIVNRRITIIK